MLDALNRTVAAEVITHFQVQESDLYFLLHESEEFLNLARRTTNFDATQGKLKVPDRPLIFLKLEEFGYDSGRSAFRSRKHFRLYVQVRGKYTELNFFTVKAGYQMSLFVPFGQQATSLLSYFFYFNRSSEMGLNLWNNQYRIPVSMLMEHVDPPSVDFTLRDRGIKLYRFNGFISALTYIVPQNVPEMGGVDQYSLTVMGPAEYVPLRKINLKFKIGGSVFSDEGVEIQETLPCLLEV